MPRVLSYLDCGCAILEGGGRVRCPTCEAALTAAPVFQEYIIRVPGDGSEHLEYIRRNYDHIPDFMRHSVAMVMDMAAMWIKGIKP